MKEENGFNYVIVKKNNTMEIIVANLIDLIKERSLKPGDKLPPERELSAVMHVSRPSLREALKALQLINIIDIRQGAGAFVKNLEPQNIVEHLDIVFSLDSSLYHDLYNARRVLESSIAKIAAEMITEQELNAIEENVRQAANAVNDPEKFLELDYELHNLILLASKNRILPVFMQSITKLNLIVREKSNSNLSIRKRSVVDHQKILDALKNRDPQSAATAMENHLTNVETGLIGATMNEGEVK